jgi:hypothetical protein
MLIQDHRQVMILELASSASRPRRRGAAYSIWADGQDLDDGGDRGLQLGRLNNGRLLVATRS